MGAVLLRPQVCLNCGGAMPGAVRIDRRYCKASCRTLAYRIRKRSGLTPRPRTAVPRWVDGQPPTIASVLAALAELQARVLHIAHHVEQDDIAFRHACPMTPQAEPSPETAALLIQKDAQIHALEEELSQARERLADEALQAEQRQAEAARQAQDRLQSIAAEHSAMQAERDAQIDQLRAEVSELRRKAEEAEKEYLAQVEHWTGAIRFGRSVEEQLRGELRKVQAQSNEGRAYIRELKEHIAILESADRTVSMARAMQSAMAAPISHTQANQGELAKLRAENAALSKKLTESSMQGEQRAQKWQQKAQELQTHLYEQQERARRAEDQLSELTPLVGQLGLAQKMIQEQQRELKERDREHATLLSQIESLQPDVHESDPLTILVREKLKAQHALALAYKEATQRGTASQTLMASARLRLPNAIARDEPDWDEAVTEAAALRAGYLRTCSYRPETKWAVVGQLLDPASEKNLCAGIETELQNIRRILAGLRKACAPQR